MKRSEIEEAIYNEILGSIKYHFKKDLSDMDKWLLHSLSIDILDLIEEKGMLPPETTNLSDAEIIIRPSYFEEHVPQVFALGWDEE